MSKIKVESEKLNELLFLISMEVEFCDICPNCKIDCPYQSGPVSENNCQEALYKYLQGENDA